MVRTEFPDFLGRRNHLGMPLSEVDNPFDDQHPHKQRQQTDHNQDVTAQFKKIPNRLKRWQIIVNGIHGCALCGLRLRLGPL